MFRLAMTTLASVVLTSLVMPPSAWADESTVVREFTDAGGRTVVLREGRLDPAGGFGWVKIRDKHKIMDHALVEKIVKNPNGGRARGTSKSVIFA